MFASVSYRPIRSIFKCFTTSGHHFSDCSCFGPLFQGQKVMVGFLNNFPLIYNALAFKCDLECSFSPFGCRYLILKKKMQNSPLCGVCHQYRPYYAQKHFTKSLFRHFTDFKKIIREIKILLSVYMFVSSILGGQIRIITRIELLFIYIKIYKLYYQ